MYIVGFPARVDWVKSVCMSGCLLHICTTVCLSVCQSVCLSLCLSVCVFVRLSVCCLYVRLSASMSVCLSVCMFGRLSAPCLSTCLCVLPSACLFTYLLVCPFVCLSSYHRLIIYIFTTSLNHWSDDHEIELFKLTFSFFYCTFGTTILLIRTKSCCMVERSKINRKIWDLRSSELKFIDCALINYSSWQVWRN